MKIELPLAKVQEFLSHSLQDGSCAYSFMTDQAASTEATAWSAVAIAAGSKESVKPIIAFLLNSQNSDGGWATGSKLGKSDWTTAAATLALRLTQKYQPSVKEIAGLQSGITNACHYLLGLRVDSLSPVARLLAFLLHGSRGLQYARGWPWTADCYNWVEPTSYCLMALNLPSRVNENLAPAAISYANQFLIEHSCEGGGWNHGCFYSLGTFYPPYIITTAEALLALTDIPTNAKVQSALHFLSSAQPSSHSAMSLAWSILALNAYDLDCQSHIEKLLSLQNDNGSFGTNYLVTALSALAINTANGINPLKPMKII